MKRGGPTHPKTFDLAERLSIRRVHAVGILELLFHFAAQYAPAGDIGRYPDKRIAAACDWPGNPHKLIEALTAAHWVDSDTNHRLVVHDWPDHADRVTLQRLSRDGKTALKPNQQDTDRWCTQSDTHRARGLASSQPEPKPEPKPEPEPEPAPSQLQARAADAVPADTAGWLATFALTVRAVREAYPQTSDKFIRRLVTAVEHEIAGLDGPRAPPDEIMADAIRACHESGQKSAGLFLTTVPRCVVSWLTQGQKMHVPNGAGHKESISEKMNRTVEERIARGQNPFG